ncbi:T cell receptor alpha variable 13-1, partial [Lemmus lemmus]
ELSDGDQVEQRPSILTIQEGSSTVINCTYVDSASSYFPWYKQEHGKYPKLIIDIRSNMEKKQYQKLIVLLDKNGKQFSLHMTDTQPGDSVMYFCATDTHRSPGTCSLSSNLPQGLEPHPPPESQAFQLLVASDNFSVDIKKSSKKLASSHSKQFRTFSPLFFKKIYLKIKILFHHFPFTFLPPAPSISLS